MLLAAIAPAAAIDNGLGRVPPFGWRSWNCFHGNVNQSNIERQVDALVKPNQNASWGEAGKSLLDFGYASIGLDDNWQACGAGVNGSFHNIDGAGSPPPSPPKHQHQLRQAAGCSVGSSLVYTNVVSCSLLLSLYCRCCNLPCFFPYKKPHSWVLFLFLFFWVVAGTGMPKMSRWGFTSTTASAKKKDFPPILQTKCTVQQVK